MTIATAQFFAGTTDAQQAYLDYSSGSTNLLPAKRQKIVLNDIRSLVQQPTLHTNGFQMVDFHPAIREHDFTTTSPASTAAIRAYYTACEDLVAATTGAAEVIAFHHRYRLQDPRAPDKVKAYPTTPVPDFHIDNDASTASAHLTRVLGPAGAHAWTQPHPTRRWAIVNVWRPLATVHQLPLALLDPASVPIHATSLAEPVYTRSNYKTHIRGLKWHAEYRFWYVSEMEAGEALLFVDFESSRRWRLGGVAHGAVEVVRQEGEVLPLRRSVEVRCLVLYD